ncbi:hypothetical protein PsorP6_003406 [Peronosclerospora sorghi]|uniref:Uncharacterized protein n=1 Tax=Peronosclerospora sorghi TaxID=230839 RepID=A0ACC0VK28_9STRA|nr:hypothetical protein PsorP6_003406 [Peronosclerospora sorghi]
MDKTSLSIAPSVRVARPVQSSQNDVEPQEKRSYVFLRLKRKRTDDPLDCLVVHSKRDTKRTKADLVQAFTKLSTSENCFIFKHIDTMDDVTMSGHVKWTERLKRKVRSLKDERANMLAKQNTQISSVLDKDPTACKPTEKRVQQQQIRSKARRNEEMFKSRGLQPLLEIKEKQLMEVKDIRLVDLQVLTTADQETLREKKAVKGKIKTDMITMNGARLKPTRILNPYERVLDEAIWTAFRSNDFAPFFQICHERRPECDRNPISFQRPADGTTILMAAALHGRSDVIKVLLRDDSTSVLQQDWEGATAALFAKRGRHVSVETALLACEEVQREKAYVYDVYCIDTSATKGQDSTHDALINSEESLNQTSVNGVPIVSVSSEVQRWLSEDVPSDEVQEYMLESDIDSNDEFDGLSEDSNDEDHAANDYPDEESSDESFADSEDLDEEDPQITQAEHQRPERSCHESIHYTFAGENPPKDQFRVRLTKRLPPRGRGRRCRSFS